MFHVLLLLEPPSALGQGFFILDVGLGFKGQW